MIECIIQKFWCKGNNFCGKTIHILKIKLYFCRNFRGGACSDRQMNKFLVAIFACIMFMFSCKGNKTDDTQDAVGDSIDTLMTRADSLTETAVEDAPLPSTADELFDDFFFNFIVNKNLQLSRISFPLPIVTGDKTEMKKKEQWKMDRFFMNQGYYTLIFDNRKQMNLVKDTSVNHVVVEKIYLRKKSVKQYVFHRQRGLWMLDSICYRSAFESNKASFISFYDKFANDSVFQLESLNDPVEFTGPDPDDDFNQMEGVITADTWLAFSPEFPVNMIYNIIYGQDYKESSRKIFLIRGISNGLEIEMEFRRIQGKWKLIKLNT